MNEDSKQVKKERYKYELTEGTKRKNKVENVEEGKKEIKKVENNEENNTVEKI